MLNAALVQKHVPKDFLDAAKKYPDPDTHYPKATYQENNILKPWIIATLPNTCSASELSMCHTYKQLALRIAQLLYMGSKYAQCSSVSKKTNKLLESFGFKKITDYMGNHGDRVYIYYINLENVKF